MTRPSVFSGSAAITKVSNLLDPITGYLRRSGSKVVGTGWLISQLEAHGIRRIDYAFELGQAFSEMENTGCEIFSAGLRRLKGELPLLGPRADPVGRREQIVQGDRSRANAAIEVI